MPDHFHLIITPTAWLFQLSKTMFPNGSNTSAVKADFFSSFAAGLKACSTPTSQHVRSPQSIKALNFLQRFFPTSAVKNE
jgi:hypothetical protein